MRVKLDEHLGLAVRQLLRDRGHEMERKLESLAGCLSVADEYRTRIYGMSH